MPAIGTIFPVRLTRIYLSHLVAKRVANSHGFAKIRSSEPRHDSQCAES